MLKEVATALVMMFLGADVLAIPAADRFCRDNPDQCAIDTKEPRVVPHTQNLVRTLVEVNSGVNRRIKSVDDAEQYGMADHWTIPVSGMGDCEDYALLKRALLIEKGIPARAMIIAAVWYTNEDTMKSEGHAVLVVRTSDGDLILDNLTNRIMRPRSTGYTFVMHWSQDVAGGWVRYETNAGS